MSMDVQRNLAADPGQIRKCWHTDGDIVSDAASFNHSLVGMLGQQSSAQMSNHAADIVAAQARGGTGVVWGRATRPSRRSVAPQRQPSKQRTLLSVSAHSG